MDFRVFLYFLKLFNNNNIYKYILSNIDMKLRYVILISIIIFFCMFLTSISAQTTNSEKIFNLGGVTYSPFKQTTQAQSIFIAQEGAHKRVNGDRFSSSNGTKIIGIPDNYDIPGISGKPDPVIGTEHYPPIKYSDKMYGDIGYVPGTNPEKLFSYAKNNRAPTDSSTVVNIWNTAPLEGSYHIPVLLVDFADFPHTLDSAIFEDQFNDNTYLDGNGTSVSRYYYKESYGKLNITYDVYEWRTLSAQTYNWYGTGNNAFQFLLDTMQLFGTGPNAIDFTQYDFDNDGRIDGVVILHAGYAGEEAEVGNIRSQTRIFAQSTNYSIQGKYYGNVAIVNEITKPTFCSNYVNSYAYPTDCRGKVLTEVHEFAHVLGLPDLYQLSPQGVQVGMGLGDITMMAQQDRYPQHPINLDAWSRYFFGWITPTIIEDEMYGNYLINSIDTNSEAAYILKDNSKMNLREYFIVTNRYISSSSSNQDKWLFGGPVPGQTVLLNGGLEILHVDEAYIEAQYPTNTVMYDSDMNMYNDTVSHPGIVFEQNYLNDVSNNITVSFEDLYNTEAEVYYTNPPNFGTFDNIARIYSPSVWDTTSKTYNGLVDTEVKVQTLSVGGVNVLAYLQSSNPPLSVQILNPLPNHAYQKNTIIDFNETHIGNSGNVSCTWSKEGDAIISTNCSFSASPSSFGINYTGCSPILVPITLILKDLTTSQEVTDNVNIKVYGASQRCESANNTNQMAIID